MDGVERRLAVARIEKVVGRALAGVGRALERKGRVSGYVVEHLNEGVVTALYAIADSPLGIEVRVFPDSKSSLVGIWTVATIVDHEMFIREEGAGGLAYGAYVSPVGAQKIDYSSWPAALERDLEKAIGTTKGGGGEKQKRRITFPWSAAAESHGF